MLLAPEGDPDALDIPTPRSYAEAIEGPYSSQWQAAMDGEMASWKSTGTYVDEVPPPGANIVSGMWIFRVKRPPGSPPAFKARYVARGFTQRQGVDFFQTFSPTPKMTTLRVLLHVATQRDYELHSLDFTTAFLQGSLREEIWLRRPPGFTESFPTGTQWSLRRPVYGLRQAPRKWHDTLRMNLASLGFAPSTADPSLFLRTDATLLPFYVLVYVDDLVFATADTEALAHVKSELQKRHTCTDLGELTSYLGLRITRDRAQRTITLTQSHMVQQVLQRFGFTYSSPQSTPLPTGHSLSAPPSDESVEPSGPHIQAYCDYNTVPLSRVYPGPSLPLLRGLPPPAGAAGGAAGTGDPRAEGTGSVSSAFGGAARPRLRPYFIPLLQQVLGSPLSPGPPPPPPFLSPLPVQSQSQLQPASPLPGPSPYSGPTRGLTERREPESRPASPVRTVRAGPVSRPRLPPVPGTHSMTLRLSTVPQRVPLPSPPASSLPDGPDPESDSLRAASPTVTRFLATAVTDPLFESSAASALVAELVDFAAACRLDYAASLVVESVSASVCPPSVGGECALGTDVLEDKQEEFECFAASVPHLVSMLLTPEGDPDALDIPTPRSYAEAIEGP
ncbi:unnamed protein product [Closterium sp. NIES-54]